MTFTPGVSGNAKGRPKKGESLTDALRSVLRTRADRENIAKALVLKAMSGDPTALKLIYDRVDGLQTQKQEVTVEETRFMEPEEARKALRIIRGTGTDG